MANIANLNEYWNGHTGLEIETFLKETLRGKAGIFHYDSANNRYLIFADEQSKDEYLQNGDVNLLLGTFDAPFNYSAEISLSTPNYNAVFLNSKGNYIEFTFDVKNKNGISTGENVTIKYTITRGAQKKTITEVRKYGDFVRFNVDEYLYEGSNTITINVIGQSSLAATTAAVVYQVVNLTIQDNIDISKIYDLSEGSIVMSVPISVSGYGTKIVEYYIDGTLLDFVKSEDEVVETSSDRIKYITLSNLQEGRHSLQIRVYTTINSTKFYSNTLYRDFFVRTGVNEDTLAGIAMSIPSQYGVFSAEDATVMYEMTQYITYNLRFAVNNPKAVTTDVEIKLGDVLLGTVTAQNNKENYFTIQPTTSGPKVLSINDYAVNSVISPTSMSLQELTSNLILDFNALGRTNNSNNKDVWSYGDYTGTFKGFKWNTSSGWNNGRLLLDDNSSLEIDFNFNSINPTDNGVTFEMEWMTKNVSNDDAVICDMRNSKGAGLVITATKIRITSNNGITVETDYKPNELVRVGIVINKTDNSANKRMTMLYCNGVISRCESWSIGDNYSSDTNMTITGSEEAHVELKNIKIYNIPLSSDNMLNNYNLYRDSIEEMLEVYNRNDIYEEGSTIMDYNKMAGRLPVMIVTGDIPTLENTSDKDTQITVDIEYINLQDSTRSFTLKNAAMRPQGTSSMGYPKKNFRIYTNKLDNTVLYNYEGKIVEDRLYSFKDNAQSVDCWCLKADYAESSGTHNTGIAKLWNKALINAQVTHTFGVDNPRNINSEYVLRTKAQQAAIDAGYKYDVRTTIDGFPILLFYRPSANDDIIFIGKYNFNNDKSTESVFGFVNIPNFDNSKVECWEILNNGNPLALFTSFDGFDEGWSEAFESRYPDTKNPNIDNLREFCIFMANVSEEQFSVLKWNRLDVWKIAAYYVYLMRHGGADQFVKNAMLTTEDGIHYFFILYDNDTVHGLINTGHLRLTPDVDRQTVDDSGSYVFAGHDSRLWNLLEADEEFMQIVASVDNALYSAGISYEEAIKTFDVEQAGKWVERVYNQDAQYKYVGPFVNNGINNLFMLQGKRDLHRKWWLAKRFNYYDSKFVSGSYKSNAIEIKCLNGTEAGQQFSITAGYPLFYGYGINNVPREKGIMLEVNESKTFTTKETVNVGDPIRIYGAPNIKKLDLHLMSSRLAVLTVANAYTKELGTKLEKLIIGNLAGENNELTEISGISNLTALEELDIQGMRKMLSIDLSNQTNLKIFKAKNSGLTSATFAKGAPIERLEIASLNSLILNDLPKLNASNLIIENLSAINTVDITDCPNITNNFAWVNIWYLSNSSDTSRSLIMNKVDWEGVSVDALIELKNNLHTLDLQGRVKVTEVTEQDINTLMELFGSDVFDVNAKFYVDAPPAIFLTGPTEVLEGNSAKYEIISFGEEIRRITYKLTNGNSYITLDDEGNLTTTEGCGSRTVTVTATVITEDGDVVSKEVSVYIKSKVYPSSSYTTLNGETRPELGESVYSIVNTQTEITGEYTVEWSLSENDGYAEIKSSTIDKCVVNIIKAPMSLVTVTLSANFVKVKDSVTLFTKTIEISIINENIAETDAGVVTALYNAGLCASPDYITKDEAALITGDDLFPNGAVSSILSKPPVKIKSFMGFKYFTGFITMPNNGMIFRGGEFSQEEVHMTLPPNLTRCNLCNYSIIWYIPELVIPEKMNYLISSMRVDNLYINNPTECSIGGYPRNNTNENIYFNNIETLCGSTITNSYPWNAYLEGKLLEDVVIPDTITSLAGEFLSYSTIKSIIANGVLQIPRGCCHHCESLEYAEFKNATSIGMDSFNASLLTLGVEMPKITSFGGTCFCDSKLTSFYYNIPTIPGFGRFFDDLPELTNITIGKDVVKLHDTGGYIWKSTPKLTTIIVEPENAYYTSRDSNGNECNAIIYDDNSLVRGTSSTIVPDNAETILHYCFHKCSTLKYIDVKNVTSLKSDAFSYADLSEGIALNSVRDIGIRCFESCKFKSILLPETLISIDSTAFYGCSYLESIILPNSLISLGQSAFSRCTKLKSVILSENMKAIGGYTFEKCTSLVSIIIPDAVKTIRKYAFNECTALETVTIGTGITTIEMANFKNCTKINSFSIKASKAPTVSSDTFKSSSSTYMGAAVPEGTPKILYVPQGATGYDTGVWKDVVQDQCGFTISYTL